MSLPSETSGIQMPAARPAWYTVLRTLREASGVTQDGWAARLGVGRRTVQRWERGHAVPDAAGESALLALCSAKGLFRRYRAGPLAGVTLTSELLRALLAEARLMPSTPTAPPVAVARAPVNNLPAALSSFIGREQAVADLERLLRTTRLLTLTGPGGVGKTRLAVEAARTLLPAFPDGVWFVNLAPLRHAELVPAVVAETLGVPQTGSRSLLDGLRTKLRSTASLLLLDNCEQVVEAAPFIADLLEACPGLRVLATSRSALRLTGEQLYPVPPLPLPNADRAPRPEQLEVIASVALFVRRAREKKPDFVLTSDNLNAVAALCRDLDGLPLAIELAAARVNIFSPYPLLDRFDHRLSLLTDGPRNVPARQQTLRATIAWSVDLLTPEERQLFRRLGVFAGGCSLDDVEAVCFAAGVSNASMLDCLTALVEQSLVSQEMVRGTPRFTMLETIREYALEQLAASGEAEPVRRRHAEYFMTLAEAGELGVWGAFTDPETAGAGEVSAVRRACLWRLDADHDNLRAAFTWAGTAGEAETALRLAGALFLFWFFRGLADEGRRWLTQVLDQVTAAPVARAKALTAAGYLAWVQGDAGAAEQHLVAAVALWQRLGDEPRLTDALSGLALASLSRGNLVSARSSAEEAVRLARAGRNGWFLAFARMCLGHTARAQRDDTVAYLAFTESEAGFRRLGDEYECAVTLQGLGLVASRLGDYSAARTAFEQALVAHRADGEPWNTAEVLHQLGELAQREGELDRAEAYYGESLRLYRAVGDQAGLPLVLHHLGAVAHGRGQHERAARLVGAAQRLSRSAMLATITTPWSLAESADIEREIAAVRTALGEATFAAAWRAGHALTLEGAISEAVCTS